MEKILFEHIWILLLIFLWTLPWKAAALWKSARRAQLGWFLTIIVLNTLGILEIIYIFFFSDKEDNQKNQPSSTFDSRFKFDQARSSEEVLNRKIIM